MENTLGSARRGEDLFGCDGLFCVSFDACVNEVEAEAEVEVDVGAEE